MSGLRCPEVNCPRTQVTLRPDPKSWVRAVQDASPDDQSRRLRAQLGLPTDRPIVMTGHQAQVWHPGILAKFIAAQACAEASDAAPVWLVVDQDTGEPGALTYPSDQGSLHEARMDCPPSRRVPGETPTGSMPPLTIPAEAPADAPPALGPILDALRAHDDAPDASSQLTGALSDLLSTHAGLTPAPGHPAWLRASTLSKTDLFNAWVDKIQQDPGACVRAYNAAASSHPDAGIRELSAREEAGRYELPLWRIRPGEPRIPVYSHMLADIPRDQLAPRALLMTAILRRAACDLFIHGTGGGSYDLVAEEWIRGWLGEPLSPMVVATATCTLDLGIEPVLASDVARARWRAHTAVHEPALLGDDETSKKKRALVEEIEHAKQTPGMDPKPIYRSMHALLEEARASGQGRLDALQKEADRLDQQAQEAEIATIRTWPFPLYPRETLDSLRRCIRGAFDLA